MKFRFCGDGDCPDWVLAEIHSTLSILSSVKLKILAQMMVKNLLGEDIPEEKLKEIFSANKSDLTPTKTAFACLRFLIVNAIRYNTDNATFIAELQQLGLPKEHSATIARVCKDYSSDIKSYLLEHSLKVNELTSVSYTIPSDLFECAQLSIEIGNEIVDGLPTKRTHKVNISKSDIPILLDELKMIKMHMEKLDLEGKSDTNVESET